MRLARWTGPVLRPFRRIALLAVLALGLQAVALPGTAARAETLGCPAVVTVTGAITRTNRPGYDPATDKFFAYNEIDFSRAHALDCEALRALAQTTVRADFPKGKAVQEYTGVPIAALMEAVGATGKTLQIRALDGYMVEAPLDELIAKDAVLALSRNGKPLGIGDFGPAQIVFPRAERADLKDMNDDLWVWSVFHIGVE